jgi:hypothetical protein
VIVLPQAGLFELDKACAAGRDGVDAEAAGAVEPVEPLRSRPALIKDDVLMAIVPSVVGDGHLPFGGANAEELCRSPKVVDLVG